jgi:hypothetical protein
MKEESPLETGYRLLQSQTGRRPFLDCIILSNIKTRVLFGSWLGSYHKYGTYLVTSHYNIDIPMESSVLTRLRSKPIPDGLRTVVQSTPKQIDSFWQVLGLGWVYLATEALFC